MHEHLRNLERARDQLVSMIELYNSGNVDAFVEQHLDEVKFNTPLERGIVTSGTGKAGLRESVLRGRQNWGGFSIVDVFPLGGSVSLLLDNERGQRTEFCLELGDRGLLKSVFAFHVSPRSAAKLREVQFGPPGAVAGADTSFT